MTLSVAEQIYGHFAVLKRFGSRARKGSAQIPRCHILQPLHIFFYIFTSVHRDLLLMWLSKAVACPDDWEEEDINSQIL